MTVTIGALKTIWETVSNWVNGSDTISKPKVTIAGSVVSDVVLQNSVSAIGNGSSFDVGSFKTITIEISGTSTSRTVIFEGASVSGTYYAMKGVRLSDFTTGTETTATGEIWQFDVTGLVNFRARISSIAGGSVSVLGKAVI